MRAPTDVTTRRSLGVSVLKIFVAPRRAGRTLAHTAIGSAVTVHLLSLLAIAAAVGVSIPQAERMTGMDAPTLFAEGLKIAGGISISPGAGSAISPIVWAMAAVAFVIAELLYWCLGVVVLGAWIGVDTSRRSFYNRGVRATGYATVWLVPLSVGWTFATAALVKSLITVSGSGFLDKLLPLGTMVLTSIVPAAALAMAMRLAAGMGDVLEGDPPPTDKTCEGCGYNLHATDPQGRCPECGRPAKENFDPDLRQNGWEMGRQGYWATLKTILISRNAMTSVRIRSHADAARRFMVRSVLLSSVLFGLGMTLTALAYSCPRNAGAVFFTPRAIRVLPMAMSVGLLYGGIWAMAVLGGSMIFAASIFAAANRRGDRLGTRGAMKLACYLSGMAIPFAIASTSLVTAVFYAIKRGWIPNTAPETLRLAFAIGGGILFAWYWRTGAWGYSATRYSNT